MTTWTEPNETENQIVLNRTAKLNGNATSVFVTSGSTTMAPALSRSSLYTTLPLTPRTQSHLTTAFFPRCGGGGGLRTGVSRSWNLEKRCNRFAVKCNAAVAEKETAEEGSGEKSEYQAEVVRFLLKFRFLNGGHFSICWKFETLRFGRWADCWIWLFIAYAVTSLILITEPSPLRMRDFFFFFF